jgi:predicted amidophosphoribosyltransferase
MKTANLATPSANRQPQELEICISCLKTNAPGTHFCRHCGTPLTSFAATAPFESIFAEGDMWRKAVSRGRHGWLVRLLIIAFLVCLLLSIILGWMLPR